MKHSCKMKRTMTNFSLDQKQNVTRHDWPVNSTDYSNPTRPTTKLNHNQMGVCFASGSEIACCQREIQDQNLFSS